MTPNFDERMTIIRDRVCRRLLTLYGVPEQYRGDDEACRNFVNELAKAVNRSLPDAARGEIEQMCDTAVDRVIATYRGRAWPVIGQVCGEVDELAKQHRDAAARRERASGLVRPALGHRGGAGGDPRDDWTVEGAKAAWRRCQSEIEAETAKPQSRQNGWRIDQLKLLQAIAEEAGRRARGRAAS